jgi:hypothetical protein
MSFFLRKNNEILCDKNKIILAKDDLEISWADGI